jgi:hypothetical protein
MKMSKRFEVFINGKRICVAGMDSYGVLSAVINWVHRDPSAFSEAKKRKLSQDFFSEKISIHVGGRITVQTFHRERPLLGHIRSSRREMKYRFVFFLLDPRMIQLTETADRH